MPGARSDVSENFIAVIFDAALSVVCAVSFRRAFAARPSLGSSFAVFMRLHSKV
jgi:hypothetical protein